MKMKIFKSILALATISLIFSCNGNEEEKIKSSENTENKTITLYTHRHYDTDKTIFENFTKETGIEIQVVKASADELIQKMESEGTNSPADVLITVDAGRLVRAKSKGLLQPIQSETLDKTIPNYLKDTDSQWFGLTKRARVIVYDTSIINKDDLSTYEDLIEPKWKGKLLIRQSNNIYNQSLLASIIANNGEEKAEMWATGMVNNFARTPSGNDRDQVKAIAAKDGELAIINTYYLGRMLNSTDPVEKKAAEMVSVFFPNQNDRGTHINVSGIGVAKHAPNKEDAIKFIEYLVSKEVQEIFAKANYEYPVNSEAEISEVLKSWGEFKEDKLPLNKLGELNKSAVITFDKAGWK